MAGIMASSSQQIALGEGRDRTAPAAPYDPGMSSIVVAATGGVGNQLFQYAAARAISEALNRPIEITFRRSDQWIVRRGFLAIRRWARSLGASHDRRFALACLERSPDLMRIQDLVEVSARETDVRRGLSRRTLKRAARTGALPGSIVLRQADEVSRLLERGPSIPRSEVVVLVGEIATDRFVAPRIESLRAEIRLPTDTDHVRKWTATRRTGRPLVGVHVRRGDYLKRRIVDSVVHLSPSWYSAAAERLAERHGELEYVVVSDDPAWCRETLRLPGTTAIASLDHPKDPLEDLALLSRCDHHIIANSTFSWWGARLAPIGGDVVAPTCWWIDPPIGREMLAEEWIPLANSRDGRPIGRSSESAVV
jgi:hypothetical protein